MIRDRAEPWSARLRKLCAAVALVGALASLASAAAALSPPAVLSAWVQMTPAGAEVRVVQETGPCVSVRIGDTQIPLVLRAAASDRFPQVCAVAIPRGADRVQLADRTLKVPVPVVRRIVVFGDSGCRIKGLEIQACNDPAAWPFAEVARRAAARRPDLVIHVGDYYYREGGCPVGDLRCAASPTGDRWSAWAADFFTPAAPLLQAAPWLFVRGNHETCSRGGEGWFRLLDAGAAYTPCPAEAASWAADIGGLALYALDSSSAPDRDTDPASVKAFALQLDALTGPLARTPGWIVVHRPIWGLVPVARLGPLGPVEATLNQTEQQAVRGRDLGAVAMVMSGHIHDFASLSFEGGARPAQLIVGTGGDVGPASDSPNVTTKTVELDGQSALRTEFDRFGYMVLDRQDEAGRIWTGVFYDAQDRAVVACRLDGRALSCRTQR